MNANKQDAGGLPELPEPLDHLAHADGFNVIGEVAVYTADQMRAYGELCRAAPAGGDARTVPFSDWMEAQHELGELRTMLARSAPAGSGEVEECLMSSEHEWTILDCPHCGRCVKYCKKAISSKEAYRDLTAEVTSLRAERDALLRKLQQGADYVMVPREPTSKMAALGAIAHKERGMAAAYRAMIAASQEGGTNG